MHASAVLGADGVGDSVCECGEPGERNHAAHGVGGAEQVGGGRYGCGDSGGGNAAGGLGQGFSAAPAKGGEGGATPPDGYGALPQEAVVRDIITDVVTDKSADDLTSRKGRDEIKALILKRLNSQTDVKVHDVLLTDIAVQ